MENLEQKANDKERLDRAREAANFQTKPVKTLLYIIAPATLVLGTILTLTYYAAVQDIRAAQEQCLPVQDKNVIQDTAFGRYSCQKIHGLYELLTRSRR